MRVSTTNAIITNAGKFNDAEGMDFTGHKSVQSLQIYWHVNKEKKMQMSKELSKVINKMKEQVQEEEKHYQLPTELPNNATSMAKSLTNLLLQ